MASLDLKLEPIFEIDPRDAKTPVLSAAKSRFGKTATAYSNQKVFAVLRDFLQPDTAMPIKSAVKSILDLLPAEAAESEEIWSFGEVCLEIAEQIPYSHPSQIKLALLLEQMGQSHKLTSRFTSTWAKGGDFFFQYQRLGESMRKAYNGPYEDLGAWVNLNAFLAHLHEFRIWTTDPTYAIWALREGLEEKHEKDNDSLYEAHILAAAQWIIWSGQCLYKQVIFVDLPEDLRPWTAGPLYGGKSLLTLDRWKFWRVSFASIGKEKDRFGEECRNVALRAAEIMRVLEESMIGPAEAADGETYEVKKTE